MIAPAAVIPRFLEIPHLNIENAAGTVWRGNAETSLDSQPIGTLTWRVNPKNLFKGELKVDFELKREGLSLNGISTSGFDTHEVTLNGVVGSRFLNVYTVDYDIRLAGEIEVNDVKIRLRNGNRVDTVEGNLTWDGGPVHFKLANVLHEVTLEPVVGSLALDANLIELSVQRTQSEGQVLAFRFDPASGWIHLTAFPAFLEFANVPSNYLMQDADFLFEVSQRIL